MKHYPIAFALYQKGQFSQSLNALEKAAELSSQDLLLKAANLICLNQCADAERVLQELLRIEPANLGAQFELAKLQFKRQSFCECIATLANSKRNEAANLLYIDALIRTLRLREAKSLLLQSKRSAEQAIHWHLLDVDYELASGHYLEASELLHQLLNQHHNNFHLQYKLACLYRDVGETEKAKALFIDLQKQQPKLPELSYVVGCCAYELGDYRSAQQALLHTLSLAPNYIPAHESLNKLYWHTEQEQHYMSSYKQTLHHYDWHPDLVLSAIEQLIRIGHIDEAQLLCAQGLVKFNGDPRFVHAQALILDKQGNAEQAYSLFREAANLCPSVTRYQIDLANCELELSHYHAAETLIKQALDYAPDNQELWAYLSTIWRLKGDERWQWLCDYEHTVKVKSLPTPARFSQLSDFLTELSALLTAKHRKVTKQPLDQSVELGTQTSGNLLFSNHVLIKEYKWALHLAITEYLASLPTDRSHPLYRRNYGQFKVNGSWSVQLGKGGYHRNHIHPSGWISAPAYIQVPKSMHKDDPTRSGWLRLGETCLNLGEREQIDKLICPQPGQIIIFPSYLWHGTYPITSEQPRITLPTDIMPTA